MKQNLEKYFQMTILFHKIISWGIILKNSRNSLRKYMDIKVQKRIRRHKRIRAKVSGASLSPRVSVFKSNRALLVQVIDDEKGTTLAAVSDQKMKGKTKSERAKEAGLALAKIVKAKKIDKVVFDRGGFIYTGRVKALADGLREGGLEF